MCKCNYHCPSLVSSNILPIQFTNSDTVPKYVSQVFKSDNFTFTCHVCMDKPQLNLANELSDKIENISSEIKKLYDLYNNLSGNHKHYIHIYIIIFLIQEILALH